MTVAVDGNGNNKTHLECEFELPQFDRDVTMKEMTQAIVDEYRKLENVEKLSATNVENIDNLNRERGLVNRDMLIRHISMYVVFALLTVIVRFYCPWNISILGMCMAVFQFGHSFYDNQREEQLQKWAKHADKRVELADMATEVMNKRGS